MVKVDFKVDDTIVATNGGSHTILQTFFKFFLLFTIPRSKSGMLVLNCPRKKLKMLALDPNCRVT